MPSHCIKMAMLAVTVARRRLRMFFWLALGTAPLLAGAHQTSVPLVWKTETTTGYRTAAEVASGQGYVASVGNHWSNTCGPCGYDASVQVQVADTGKLVWSTNYDLGGTNDFNNAVVISDDVVITAGISQGQATSGHSWWVVSGYALTSGALLWRDVLGDASTDYYPWMIAVQNGRAYVTGAAGATCVIGASTTCDQFTRVYDLSTGSIFYSLREDPSHGGDDESLSVALDGQLMYIGGSVGTGPKGQTGAAVRAYDAASGALVWDDVIPQSLTDGSVFQVVARGDRLIAIASVNDDWLVRCYDAATGVVRWTQTYSLLGAGIPGMYDTPIQVAMDGSTVVVAGYGSTEVYGTEKYPKASRDWVVRAYDVSSGDLLWSDHSGSSTDADEADGGVVISDGRAYALGFLSEIVGSTHTLVRAYDARTGRILWNDSETRSGFPGGITTTLSADAGLMTAASYVAGTRPPGTPPPDSDGSDLLVKTYAIGN